MRLYAKDRSGQIHVRNTDTDYQYAIVGNNWIGSWHTRHDLATKALSNFRGSNPGSVTPVLKEAHGPCGHCNGSGYTPHQACRGRVEYDVKDTKVEDMPGPNQYTFVADPRGYTMRYEVSRHIICPCKTSKTPGLVKCHVCRGKGTL